MNYGYINSAIIVQIFFYNKFCDNIFFLLTIIFFLNE